MTRVHMTFAQVCLKNIYLNDNFHLYRSTIFRDKNITLFSDVVYDKLLALVILMMHVNVLMPTFEMKTLLYWYIKCEYVNAMCMLKNKAIFMYQ